MRVMLCLIIGLLCSKASFAQGVYLGAAYGMGRLSMSSGGQEDKLFSTKQGLGATRLYGGYAWNRLGGIEIGYTTFNKARVTAGNTSSTVDINAMYVALFGHVPVASNFYLAGRIGMAMKKSSSNISQLNKSLNGMMFTVGLEYLVDPKTSFSIDYEYYGPVTDQSKLSIISVSGRYGF